MRMATIKKTPKKDKNRKKTSVGETVEQLEDLCTVGGAVKWKTVGQLLKKSTVHLPYDRSKDENESESGVYSSKIPGRQELYKIPKPRTGLQPLTESSQGCFNFNSGERALGSDLRM